MCVIRRTPVDHSGFICGSDTVGEVGALVWRWNLEARRWLTAASRYPFRGQHHVHPEASPVIAEETRPTQRDRHLQRFEPRGSPDIEPRGSPDIAEHGRITWQKWSGYNTRTRAEAAMGRWKQVIGDGLRSHTDERRATEVAVAAHTLNCMLDLGRPACVRIA